MIHVNGERGIFELTGNGVQIASELSLIFHKLHSNDFPLSYICSSVVTFVYNELDKDERTKFFEEIRDQLNKLIK